MYNKPTPAFRCPICRSSAFEQVIVRRPKANPYVTDFLQCAGCSVMFRDAAKFTRFEPYTPPAAAAAPAPDLARLDTSSTETTDGTSSTDREAKRRARLVRN